jgi:outer membrane biosynthesis protein TonB
MACPNCNARVGAKDRYCKECGGRLLPPGDTMDDASASMSWSESPLRPRPTHVVDARARWVRRGVLAALYLALAAGSAFGVRALLHSWAGSHEGTITLGKPRLVVLGGDSLSPAQPPVAPTVDSAPSPGRTAGRRPTPPRTGRPAVLPSPKPTSPSTPVPAPTPTPTLVPKPAAKPAPKPASKPKPKPASKPAKPAPKPAKPATKPPDVQDQIDDYRASLNADSVRMVVRHHLPQVRACYERALKQKKDLAGIVEIKFQIKTDGSVGSSSVHRNTSGHEGLGKCLAIIIKRWRYPRPVGGEVLFVYPFVFSKPGD